MLLKEVMVQNARNMLHIFASTEKKLFFFNPFDASFALSFNFLIRVKFTFFAAHGLFPVVKITSY
jgi:hypothetical protein